MYKDTITLFNRHADRAGDVWYPTILRNVNLNMDKASIMTKYGAESKDSVVLNIRYHISQVGKMVGDKVYLPPKEWQGIDDPAGTITFKDGKEFDFFRVGEWESTEPIRDEDYTNGFYNYLNSKRDYVFAITAVGLYSVIPHFEIMGR